MGYSLAVVKKVRDEFENKRSFAVNTAAEHQKQVYLKCPVVREIDLALSQTGMNVFRAAVDGSDGLEEKIKLVRRENEELQKQKRELLKMSGFPTDYTDIKYECEKCSDTGFVGVEMCSCMRKALSKEAYSCSGLGKYLDSQTFDNFSLMFYSDTSAGGKPSPREAMRSIAEKAKQYVKDFGKEGKESNLLFVGKTGLGKTHITTAIAKGIIDKGFDVVYDSAQNVIRAFEQQKFEKDEAAKVDVNRFFDCDLLIIDDLGTEFRNTFTQSALYNLINTRLNGAKAMIISTNLDEIALFRKNYDDRITSRLIGNFRTFRFEGTDIRIIKAKNAQKTSKQ